MVMMICNSDRTQIYHVLYQVAQMANNKFDFIVNHPWSSAEHNRPSILPLGFRPR